MSDISEMVKKAANGDRAAFDELYKQTRSGVWFTCVSLLKNEENAKDIMQETYITALEKLGSLEKPESVGVWLNKIAANKCRDYVRSKNNTAFEENGDELLENIPDEEMCLEEYVTNAAKRAIIMDIIEKALSEEQFRTIILYYFDEMTAAEIAELMGVHEKTVLYRLKTARLKIKEEVMRYEQENNDKLHVIVPVPFLTRLFRAQSESVQVPDVPLNILQTSPNVQSVPENTAAVSTNTAANMGGKALFNTLKSKIIAGACAAVVVGGGVTAGVVIANNSKNKTESKPAVSTVSSASTSTKTSVSSAPSGNGSNTSLTNLSAESSEPTESEFDPNKVKLAENEIITVIEKNNKKIGACDKITVTAKAPGKASFREYDYNNVDLRTDSEYISYTAYSDDRTAAGIIEASINGTKNNSDYSRYDYETGDFTSDNGIAWKWLKSDSDRVLDDGRIDRTIEIIFYTDISDTIDCDNHDILRFMVISDTAKDISELNPEDYSKYIGKDGLKIEKYDPNAEPASEPTTSSEPAKPVKVDINKLNWDKITADESEFRVTEYDDGRQSVTYCGNSNVIKIPPEIEGVKLTNISVGISTQSEITETNIEAIYVPDGVTGLKDVAFAGYMINLKKLRLPESLTKLGDGVFGYCSSLTELDLPDGITEIGREDFCECAVKNLKLPKSLKTLGPRQFEAKIAASGSTTLESVSFPGTLKKIESRSFYNCKGLKTVTFEEGLEEIEGEAFHGCESLTEVKLPSSLKKLSLSAFELCKNATFTYKGQTYGYDQMRGLCNAVESR